MGCPRTPTETTARAPAEATPKATGPGETASLSVGSLFLGRRESGGCHRGCPREACLTAESAGVSGRPQGGEEFGLDNGSLDEESVVEVHLEGDGPARDERHPHRVPVLVCRVLHHRPTLQIRPGLLLFL